MSDESTTASGVRTSRGGGGSTVLTDTEQLESTFTTLDNSRTADPTVAANDTMPEFGSGASAVATARTPLPNYKHLPGHLRLADHVDRRVYVVRHAERVDRLFPNWLSDAFRGADYKPFDLNLPHKLPRRPTGEFAGDPPISEMGALMGSLVGRGLKLERAVVTHVFASPALHCVQTAAAIVAGMGADTLICVEPGLFEPLSLHPAGIPQLLTPARLRAFGYPVDEDYKPVVPLVTVRGEPGKASGRHRTGGENAYGRLQFVCSELLKNVPASGGGAVIVSHAATLDAMCRWLGDPDRATQLTPTELCRLGLRYPYCGVIGGAERSAGGAWDVHVNMPLPLTYLDTSNLVDTAYARR